MSSMLVLHNREELKKIPASMESRRKRENPNDKHFNPKTLKIDIPDLTPREIVELVIKYKTIPNIYVRTATLSCISKNKWLKFNNTKNEEYQLKRCLDIIIGVILFILSCPILLATSIAIRVTSKGGAIFQQPRVNNELKIFSLYKFRTMSHLSEDDNIHKTYMQNSIKNPNPTQRVHKLIDDPRITGIGKWVRRLSIDELPQLINVLKGDMSLIGPRPPIPYEVEEYAKWQYARFKAKPGLTGLWQVKGRSLIPFDEMVLLDLYYSLNRSVWGDLKILLYTIPIVLSLKGAF